MSTTGGKIARLVHYRQAGGWVTQSKGGKEVEEWCGRSNTSSADAWKRRDKKRRAGNVKSTHKYRAPRTHNHSNQALQLNLSYPPLPWTPLRSTTPSATDVPSKGPFTQALDPGPWDNTAITRWHQSLRSVWLRLKVKPHDCGSHAASATSSDYQFSVGAKRLFEWVQTLPGWGNMLHTSEWAVPSLSLFEDLMILLVKLSWGQLVKAIKWAEWAVKKAEVKKESNPPFLIWDWLFLFFSNKIPIMNVYVD